MAKGDPNYARGKFRSMVRAMATADASLRDRVKAAAITIIGAMSEADMPDDETREDWRDLHALRGGGDIDSLSDANVRKMADLICDLNSRLQ